MSAHICPNKKRKCLAYAFSVRSNRSVLVFLRLLQPYVAPTRPLSSKSRFSTAFSPSPNFPISPSFYSLHSLIPLSRFYSSPMRAIVYAHCAFPLNDTAGRYIDTSPYLSLSSCSCMLPTFCNSTSTSTISTSTSTSTSSNSTTTCLTRPSTTTWLTGLSTCAIYPCLFGGFQSQWALKSASGLSAVFASA